MSKSVPPVPDPFWGEVNGAPLKIRTMAATGEFGGGKTLLGLMIDPWRTLVLDIESSATTLNLPLKKHRVLYDEVSASAGNQIPTPEEAFVWWRDCILEIERGEYTVVVTDPINEIQSGAYDFVYRHPEMFGRTKGQYDKMTAMVWGDVKTYLEQLIGQLSNKIETFYYTLHMGQKWVAGKPVEGKRGQKAKGSDVFRKMADVLFVLDRPVDPATGKQTDKPRGVCAGPIGKSRLSHADPMTGKIQPILPPSVTGLDPAKIRQYIASPPDYARLKKDEKVQVQEMTEDDRLEVRREIAEAEREKEELMNSRIAAAEEARLRNTAARQDLSDQTAAEEAMAAVQEKSAAQNGTLTEAMPTQVKQADPSVASMQLTRSDRREIIIDSAKKLWGKDARKNLEVTLSKRGANKFADLTDEQVTEIHEKVHDAMLKKK